MSDSRPGQEPSMEEILSSIRRIIADEENGSGAASRPGAASATGDDDVLELTDVVERPAGPVPKEAAPPRGEPTPASRAPVKETSSMAAQPDSGLISPDVAAASSKTMARLARAVVPEDRDPPSPTGGVTVEQLVRELMTPVVKDWLEKNLPALVERVVEQEVKKLARRAEML